MLFFRLALILMLLALPMVAAAKLRVTQQGAPTFELEVEAREDNTAWYDAKALLSKLGGTAEWSVEDERLTYTDESGWAALKTQPPYAMRDGRAIEGVEPPRLVESKLLVSETFIFAHGAKLAGRELLVERIRAVALKRIVVDPGHGGTDRGTAGIELTEKEATFALAVRLKEKLVERGYQVHLTRTADHALGAAERAAVANYWEADLFLSLHADGQGRGDARGFELFIPPRPKPQADPRSWAGGQKPHYEASLAWARTLESKLGELMATFDRGTTTLPSPLLEAVTCPAALLVVGNLGWPGEAALFEDTEERELLVETIGEAVDEFFIR